MPGKKPFKDRLNQKLNDNEMLQLQKVQVELLADEGIDPAEQFITKPYVDAIIDRMAVVNPDWDELPSIKEIWSTPFVEHLKGYLRN